MYITTLFINILCAILHFLSTYYVMFERRISQRLRKWKDNPLRKPLLLMGARQVGKTFTLLSFARENYPDFAYFNLEKSSEIHEFFKRNHDPDRIIERLTLYRGRKLDPKNSLIILDEIQECPEALVSLKYFQEDKSSYQVVGAGSLLGISMGKDRSFPVGKVEFLDMYPLTFSEYLQTLDQKLFTAFDHFLQNRIIEKIPNAFFEPITDYFHEYLFSGGMPEAAKVFSESRNREMTANIQEQILRSYRLDFAKHIKGALATRIQYVWDSIPSQLSKENRKFIYNVIRKGARAREYENAITWLEQAGLVYKIYHLSKPVLPLSAYRDLPTFKIYLLDVGLLNHMAGLDPVDVLLARNKLQEFKGAMFENYVAQALVAAHEGAPYYWTSSGIAEIDFIISDGKSVYPVEVKAGKSLKGRSLAVYKSKYNPTLRIRLSPRNLTFDDDLLNIPLFYADHISTLANTALSAENK